jgi:putative restriction endonuclease
MPYGRGGEHRVDNGLLLRRDLHRLFDRGYVTVTPDHIFRVGDKLREEFKNGRSYYGLNTSKIRVPTYESWRPNRDFLDWHAREVFKG